MMTTSNGRLAYKSQIADFETVSGRIVNTRQLPPSSDYQVPTPNDPSWSPTQQDLDAATQTVIEIENEINVANAQVEALMVDRVELFARYNAAWADASAPGDASYINELMTTTTGYLDLMYNQWTARRDELQAFLSVWIAARAKIEHDIAWQSYVAERYGDTDIQRASAAGRLAVKAAA